MGLAGLLEDWRGPKAVVPPYGGSGLRGACRPSRGILPEAGLNLINLFSSWGEKTSSLMYPTNQKKRKKNPQVLRKMLGKLIPFGWSPKEEI